jgi:Ribonuclease G/E
MARLSQRKAYLDRGIGETRGVVTVDGHPERLFIVRDSDDPFDAPGARGVARIRRIERAFTSAFVELPGGASALLPMKAGDPALHEGQAVDVEVRIPSRRGKSAVVRLHGLAEGEPRQLSPAPDLTTELAHWVKAAPITGEAAREAADHAEELALSTLHALPGGGRLSIEPTRALVAIDVDLGDRPGADAKRAARAANLAALTAGARLLRLKGLGGLIVFDLVGRGHDGPALTSAARQAFSLDNPGVAIGPISKFGALEMTVPRIRRPVAEDLLDEMGAPTPQTSALRLVRALEREGRASPGARLTGRCDPLCAQAFAAFSPALAARLGARFAIESPAGWPVGRLEVSAR